MAIVDLDDGLSVQMRDVKKFLSRPAAIDKRDRLCPNVLAQCFSFLRIVRID
jgi:hypothetical protein